MKRAGNWSLSALKLSRYRSKATGRCLRRSGAALIPVA